MEYDENYDIPFGNGILPHYPDDPLIPTMDDVYRAIDEGILPERIYQGSSGSYFARNIDMVTFPATVSCEGKTDHQIPP